MTAKEKHVREAGKAEIALIEKGLSREEHPPVSMSRSFSSARGAAARPEDTP